MNTFLTGTLWLSPRREKTSQKSPFPFPWTSPQDIGQIGSHVLSWTNHLKGHRIPLRPMGSLLGWGQRSLRHMDTGKRGGNQRQEDGGIFRKEGVRNGRWVDRQWRLLKWVEEWPQLGAVPRGSDLCLTWMDLLPSHTALGHCQALPGCRGLRPVSPWAAKSCKPRMHSYMSYIYLSQWGQRSGCISLKQKQIFLNKRIDYTSL